MNLALTNYGLRIAAESLKEQPLSKPNIDPSTTLLNRLQAEILVPYRDNPAERDLVSRQLAELIPDRKSRETIALRYKRNPLEHVKQIMFEFTSRCNLHCRHCYNASVERVTETDLRALNSAADIFIDMGIMHFNFIGGEVSKFGDGWLEVVRHIHSRSNAIVTLFTSGWWLGKQDFQAAGSIYGSDKHYLSALHKSGLTHILFSIDGLREAHDRFRRLPGLFDRMLAGFATVKDAGLEPRVSVLVGTGIDVSEYFELLDVLAQKIYSFPPGTKKGSRIERITCDPLNIFSNLIDIGNQASVKRYGNFYFHAIPDELLYCKGFYRPSPFLTIKANGEVATCRLANAGEGYGNIHKEGLLQTLNRMQSSFVYQLHAEHEVGKYRRLMNKEVFGEYFDHICTVRAILTLLARRIHESGINPDDPIVLHRINLEVAQTTGHARKGLLKKSSQIRE